MNDQLPSIGNQAGFAVRRDWPNGEHDIVTWRLDPDGLDRWIVRDHEFWLRGPYCPVSWTVVLMSLNDFDLHASRHTCRAPDCPTAAVSV